MFKILVPVRLLPYAVYPCVTWGTLSFLSTLLLWLLLSWFRLCLKLNMIPVVLLGYLLAWFSLFHLWWFCHLSVLLLVQLCAPFKLLSTEIIAMTFLLSPKGVGFFTLFQIKQIFPQAELWGFFVPMGYLSNWI